jgi:N-acylneuraminate cytidylyltransferase
VVKRRVAIIPARGGSKRLPRKNVMDFFGKPMIAWTIEAAKASGLFDRVIVTTEDDEIASVAEGYGADVPFRREKHFDDYSPVSAATVHALDQIRIVLGEEYDVVCQLMANCPLRGAEDILSAHAAFDGASADFQISCTRFGWLNPWWALKLDGAGAGTRLFPEQALLRSQDQQPLYCPTGAIWMARAAQLASAGTFYGPGHRFEPMPTLSAIDIDDEHDLEFARAAYILRNGLQVSS